MKINFTFEKKQMFCTFWAVLAPLLMPLGAWAQIEPNLEDGYYLISNTEELIWFRDQVNSGNTTINVKLTADIDLTDIDFKGIGDTDHTFSGHFDGQFHSISNMQLYREESVIGFFRYAGGGAIIENLIIDATSSIESGKQTAGGIVGICKVPGSLTIRRCGNEATVTAPKVVAGILGCMLYNGESDELHIVDCYNCGNVFAEYKVSMFCGQIDIPQEKIEIKDCWNCGNLVGEKIYSINAINNRTDYTSDSQYKVVGSPIMFFNSKTECTNLTDEELANGALTSMLNKGETNGDQVWYQKIGEDAYPVFVDTKDNTVYCINDLACDGKTARGCHYSNNADEAPIVAEHNFGADGFCTECPAIQPATLNGEYYEIGNAGNLFWFRGQVNNGNTTINGKLTADIDLSNEKNYTPIGNTESTAYAGKFNGQFHRIMNMHIDSNNGKSVGFFGYASAKSQIERVIIDSSCSIKSSTANYVGGVLGQHPRNGETDKFYLRYCGNEASIEAAGNVGGVMGGNRAYNPVEIQYCYNTGNLKSTNGDAGTVIGFIGNNNTFWVKDCWNSGTVTATGNKKYVLNYQGTVHVSNCYGLEGTPLSGGESAKSFKSYELANGALAYKMNGGKTDGTQVWYQKIGVDEHPVFAQGNTVYHINDLACDGHTSQGYHYSNDANDPRKVADHKEAKVGDDDTYDIVCQNCKATLRKCFHYDSENTVIVTKNQEGAWYADSEIHLSDSYDYTSPVTFIARSVSYTRPMSNNYEYGSLILPFAAKSDDNVTLYSLAGASNGNVTFQKKEIIAAGTPCIFRVNKGENAVITGENVTLSAMTKDPVDGVAEGGMQMHGTYQKLTGQTNLWFLAKDALYHSSTAPVTFMPFRSWLTGDAPAAASSMRNIIIEEEGMTTAIECINSQAESTASCTYDLQGRLVKNQKSGIMIQNGKKVLVGSK